MSMMQPENREFAGETERQIVASAFSHDLRTSLAVLQGYMEMLEVNVPKGAYSSARLLEVVGAMSRQVCRLGAFVEDMGELQKLEDLPCRPRETSLAELSGDLWEAGRILCASRQKAFDLSVEYPQRAGRAVRAAVDRELVVEVFENLVANGARYAAGRVEAALRLEESSEDAGVYRCLRLSVKDDGPGFGKEALKNAADPFYSEETGTEGHLGMGLYICRLLCEKHGGRLTVGNGADGGGELTAEFRLGDMADLPPSGAA